jgi:lipopolysaccharide export system permease protein
MVGDNAFSHDAKTKGISQLLVDIDSINKCIDSIAAENYKVTRRNTFAIPKTTMSNDSSEIVAAEAVHATGSELKKEERVNLDSAFYKLSSQRKQNAVLAASQRVNIANMDLMFRADDMKSWLINVRKHISEIYSKITMSLAVLLFFFIGAPLGAIIRKGGLGVSVVVSVLIFIFYYVVNTAGVKVGREGSIPIELGVWMSTIILAPIGLFLTIKSNNDSAVFNKDAYVAFFRRLWGIRQKRHIAGKEVVINDPDYEYAENLIDELARDARTYLSNKKLRRISYFIKLYFGKVDSSDIESISDRLEYLVEMLSNSKKKQLIVDLNSMPIVDYHSFRFYRRVRSDMKNIISVGEKLKQDIYGK